MDGESCFEFDPSAILTNHVVQGNFHAFEVANCDEDGIVSKSLQRSSFMANARASRSRTSSFIIGTRSSVLGSTFRISTSIDMPAGVRARSVKCVKLCVLATIASPLIGLRNQNTDLSQTAPERFSIHRCGQLHVPFGIFCAPHQAVLAVVQVLMFFAMIHSVRGLQSGRPWRIH